MIDGSSRRGWFSQDDGTGISPEISMTETGAGSCLRGGLIGGTGAAAAPAAAASCSPVPPTPFAEMETVAPSSQASQNHDQAGHQNETFHLFSVLADESAGLPIRPTGGHHEACIRALTRP